MNKTRITSLGAPHIHSHHSVSEVMRYTIISLVPGIIASIWVLGWGMLIHCVMAIVFAILFETLILVLRKRPLQSFIFDGSAIITALLFALAITPFAPWWVTLCGIFFAIVFAKHLYGGLGYNIFNPAMAGYAFVLVSFPAELNYWPMINHDANLHQTIAILFDRLTDADMDGLSGATPLTFSKLKISSMAMLSEFSNIPLFGLKGWGWINLAFLVGGCCLIIKGIIKWQIPVIILFTVFVLSIIFHNYDPERYVSATFYLFTGGTFLAAFFIATDPVTSATTPLGKIIYAAGIGIFIYTIRTWGNYPDGIAFSVLFMNAMVPLIDYMTRPKVFGGQTT